MVGKFYLIKKLNMALILDIIRKKGVESVIFPTCHSYYWPNALQSGEGKLVIRDQKPYVKTLYTKGAIDKMVEFGDYDYQKYNFPKIYHGIVKRECLDKIKEKTGYIPVFLFHLHYHNKQRENNKC